MVCRTADNGRLAFAMASHDPPDAIILDINMPVLDGFQVLEELRRLEPTRTLKVMLLTARYDPEDITRGVFHGADDYMVKPFDPARLVERLKTLLSE
jgi:DNA-binding response OmpR family regulator